MPENSLDCNGKTDVYCTYTEEESRKEVEREEKQNIIFWVQVRFLPVPSINNHLLAITDLAKQSPQLLLPLTPSEFWGIPFPSSVFLSQVV